jgi:hypothetical protein
MLLRPVLCFVASLLLLAGSAYAQRTVSYQGYLTDDAGTPITQTDLAIDFGVFDVAVGGTSLWAESQNVDVEDGIFTTALGQNTPFPPTLDFNEALYLELTVDGTALTPRVLLRAAPSALAIPGVHARPDQNFVGINRENRIGSEYFGVRAPVFTSGTSAAYGGMYMETAGAGSRPFYGYATDGNSKAWHYYDGNTDKWHLNVNGNRLTVLADGRVGIGTTSPENPLSVAGLIESTAGGIQFPDGTVQASAASGFSLPFSGTVSTSSPALQIRNSQANGISGTSGAAGSYGGSFVSIASSGLGAGLFARGNLGAAPDLVLGANDSGTEGDDGIIASDPDFSGSDIILQSNDRVWVQLDADQNGDTDEFSIRDDAGDEIFEVNGQGDIVIDGEIDVSTNKSRVNGPGPESGFVRAGANVYCPRSSSGANVNTRFNNVNSSEIIATTSSSSNRRCLIDFGFEFDFYSVTPTWPRPYDVQCGQNEVNLGKEVLICEWKSGNITDPAVEFMIIVY